MTVETYDIPNGHHIGCQVAGCNWTSPPFPGERPPEHVREQAVIHVKLEHWEVYRALKAAEGGEAP